MTSGFSPADGPAPPGGFVPPDNTTSPPASAPVPPGYAPPPGYQAPPPGYGYPPPTGYYGPPFQAPPRPVDRGLARGLILTLVTLGLLVLGCVGVGASLVVRAHRAVDEQPAPPAPYIVPGGPMPSGLPTGSLPSGSPPPGPTAPVPPGAPVRDGPFEFTVQKIECGKRTVGSRYLAATAKGQYCLVPLAARNVTAEKDFFVISYQKLVTTTGTAVDADIPAILGANDGNPVFLGQVEPGATTSGIMVFDIPKDATVAYLEVHGDSISRGAKVTAS